MSKKPQVNGSGLGMDTLLTTHGKALQSGQEVRFVLVKGPSSSRTLSADPVNEKAPKEAFPLVAKFPESVVTPDFTNKPWNAARFYQRDTPKAQDDSDEEGQAQTQPKKRWRARNQEVKRQWVLQEEVEFLETMMAKRQGGGGTDDNASKKQLTSRVYEGVPERNSSQFVLLEANANIDNNIRVTILPTPNETIRFRQPKAVKTLSMSEAEQALDDQRNKTSRFMMHDQQRIFQGQAPIHRSRTRLLGKLMADNNNNNNGDEDNDLDKGSGKKRAYKRKRLDGGNDEDDVMGDLSFQNTKGSAKARQELLNSFGNDMRVDADGVLGGANDAVFGQRGQRFGHFSMTKEQKAANKSSTTAAKTGHDGNAMADDFYQRDVQAEYEELDYDANEQFDDDDVDVGETDVVMGDSNFGGIDDDEENDEDLEEGMHGETPTGAEGLASLAGFRLMLAKAKMTPEQLKELAEMNKRQAEEEDLLAENNKNNNSNNDDKNKNKKKKKEETETDHLAKIMEAAEKARLEAESKEAAQNAAENAHLEADESKPNANNSNNNNNNNINIKNNHNGGAMQMRNNFVVNQSNENTGETREGEMMIGCSNITQATSTANPTPPKKFQESTAEILPLSKEKYQLRLKRKGDSIPILNRAFKDTETYNFKILDDEGYPVQGLVLSDIYERYNYAIEFGGNQYRKKLLDPIMQNCLAGFVDPPHHFLNDEISVAPVHVDDRIMPNEW